MIEIQGGITIESGIVIGDVPAIIVFDYFVTENGVDNLVTQSNDPFVEEY
jgi:hypothetical protein